MMRIEIVNLIIAKIKKCWIFEVFVQPYEETKKLNVSENDDFIIYTCNCMRCLMYKGVNKTISYDSFIFIFYLFSNTLKYWVH